MYVNPQDDKVKQLHPDIVRNIPQEKLKLGTKMKSGGKAKPVPEFLKIAPCTALTAICKASSTLNACLNSLSSIPYATGEPLPVE